MVGQLRTTLIRCLLERRQRQAPRQGPSPTTVVSLRSPSDWRSFSSPLHVFLIGAHCQVFPSKTGIDLKAAHPSDVYGPGVHHHQEASTQHHTQRAAGTAGAPKPWLQVPLECLDFLADVAPSPVRSNPRATDQAREDASAAAQDCIGHLGGRPENPDAPPLAQSPARSPLPAVKRPAPDGQRQQPKPMLGGAPPGPGPAPFPGFNALPVPAMFGGGAPLRQPGRAPAGFVNPPNPAHGQLVNAVHIEHPALDHAACKRKVAEIIGRKCAACGTNRTGMNCPSPVCTAQVAKADFLNKANSCSRRTSSTRLTAARQFTSCQIRHPCSN